MSSVHLEQPVVPRNPPLSNRGRKIGPNENKPSVLLTAEENQSVFKMLGPGRNTLSTAVVQLLTTTPDRQNWEIAETGVACFIRDQVNKTYFIQIFSLAMNSIVFRQELYSQFRFRMPAPILLTFEGDDSRIGLNFADLSEAKSFRDVLDNKIETKRQRSDRRSRMMEQTNNNGSNNTMKISRNPNQHRGLATEGQPGQQLSPSSPNGPTIGGTGTGTGMSVTTNINSGGSLRGLSNIKEVTRVKRGDRSSDKKKQRIRKEDIGLPTNFVHIQHVGWNTKDKGFKLDGVDDAFEQFFEKVGVSGDQLQDENTRNFIYSFIESHGGVEAVKKDISSPSLIRPPPTPYRKDDRAGSGSAPGPGSRGGSRSPAAPSSPRPSRPPPPARSPVGGTGNNSTNTGGGPPPPPPPPMGGIPPPPPMAMNLSTSSSSLETDSGAPKKTSAGAGGGGDTRGALMAQIQGGIALKKANVNSLPEKKSPGSLADCLDAIKSGGVGLKPVVPGNNSRRPSNETSLPGGLAGALLEALNSRYNDIHSDDSNSSEEDGDISDEWD